MAVPNFTEAGAIASKNAIVKRFPTTDATIRKGDVCNMVIDITQGETTLVKTSADYTTAHGPYAVAVTNVKNGHVSAVISGDVTCYIDGATNPMNSSFPIGTQVYGINGGISFFPPALPEGSMPVQALGVVMADAKWNEIVTIRMDVTNPPCTGSGSSPAPTPADDRKIVNYPFLGGDHGVASANTIMCVKSQDSITASQHVEPSGSDPTQNGAYVVTAKDSVGMEVECYVCGTCQARVTSSQTGVKIWPGDILYSIDGEVAKYTNYIQERKTIEPLGVALTTAFPGELVTFRLY